jgi:hypothetical protein
MGQSTADHLSGAIQEGIHSCGDKAEPWGTGCSIPASYYLLTGSSLRPSASPLGATGSGAKAAGRGCLSVSL